MNSGRSWNLPSVRQTFEKTFWSKDNAPIHYVVSKHIDAQFRIKPGKKITFSRIEAYINEFVEEFVPHVFDCLMKSCTEIKSHKEFNEDENFLYELPLKVLQELKERLLELDKLRAIIVDSDKDDFDLCVCPAKTKLSSAIEYFLEVSGTNPESLQLPSSHSTHRSRKAKDLLSYLSEESSEYQDETNSESSRDDHDHYDENDEGSVVIVNKKEEVTDEPIETLNKDVADLHKLMLELHSLVADQGEASDSIADHIQNADKHVESGNKHLKKATIVKAAMFPILGAVVGGVVGGPIGLMAGMKVGSVASGFAMAGVAGTVVGYQGGKILKKKTQDAQSQENST